jgi:hypothetical protein
VALNAEGTAVSASFPYRMRDVYGNSGVATLNTGKWAYPSESEPLLMPLAGYSVQTQSQTERLSVAIYGTCNGAPLAAIISALPSLEVVTNMMLPENASPFMGAGGSPIAATADSPTSGSKNNNNAVTIGPLTISTPVIIAISVSIGILSMLLVGAVIYLRLRCSGRADIVHRISTSKMAKFIRARTSHPSENKEEEEGEEKFTDVNSSDHVQLEDEDDDDSREADPKVYSDATPLRLPRKNPGDTPPRSLSRNNSDPNIIPVRKDGSYVRV